MAQKEKKNRAVDVPLKEHKWENLILAILSIFAIELGVLILTGTYLTIPEDAFLIGDYSKAFSWILVGLGAVSLILSVSSFYVPSIAEIKHLTADKKSVFFWNVVKVFAFSVIVVAFLFVCDWAINLVIELVASWLK